MSEVYLRELDPSYLVQVDTDLVYPEVLDGTTRNYGHVRYDDTGDYKIVTATTMASRNFVSQITSDATFPMANFAFGADKDAALIQIVDWIKFNYFHTSINLYYAWKNIEGTDYLFNFFYEGSDSNNSALATQNWTPESLNPSCWFSANQLVAFSGSLVTQWRSIVDSGRVFFFAPSGKEPVFQAKDENDGLRIYLSAGKKMVMPLNQPILNPMTVVFCAKNIGNSGNNFLYDGYWPLSGSIPDDLLPRVAHVFRDSFYASRGNPYSPITYDTNQIYSKYLFQINNQSNSRVYVDDNASLNPGNFPNGSGFGLGMTLNSRYNIDSYDGTSANIHEIMIFSSALSADDVTNIKAYFNRKWYT